MSTQTDAKSFLKASDHVQPQSSHMQHRLNAACGWEASYQLYVVQSVAYKYFKPYIVQSVANEYFK